MINRDDISALVFSVGFLSMLGTLCYQAIQFLRYGEWNGLSIVQACTIGLGIKWCYWPENWIGLYRILDFINVGVFFFIAAFIVGWGILVFDKSE